MKKKISVDEVRSGMYLENLGAAWINTPFWRQSFLISEAKDIALLKASGIHDVWIDTAKGVDVALPTAVPLHQPVPAPAGAPPPNCAPAPATMAEELAQAARICAQAKAAVTSMFREARMGNTVDAADAGLLVQQISDSVARNGSALISLARLKTADDYTYMHSVAVCAMMVALARQLGQDEDQVRAAGEAGLLHDMGKALVPMQVLNKPGKLSPEEFAIVRKHPALGHQMLVRAAGVGPVTLDVCLHHHEKTDGSGYPKGLHDDQISLFAKMAAVCDVYDAITSNRPYKKGWDPAESMRQMGQWADGHFDPTVFQAFAKSLGIYPVGSLVRLTSGLLGVVTRQTAASLTVPVVKVFFSARSRQRIAAQEIDLSADGCKEKILAREDPAKWNFTDLDVLWSGEIVPVKG